MGCIGDGVRVTEREFLRLEHLAMVFHGCCAPFLGTGVYASTFQFSSTGLKVAAHLGIEGTFVEEFTLGLVMAWVREGESCEANKDYVKKLHCETEI